MRGWGQPALLMEEGMAERIPTCPLWVGDDVELLLGAVAVTAAELVHTTGGVDQLLLAREEGVR